MKAFFVGLGISIVFSAIVTFPIIKQYSYEAVKENCKEPEFYDHNADFCVSLLSK